MTINIILLIVAFVILFLLFLYPKRRVKTKVKPEIKLFTESEKFLFITYWENMNEQRRRNNIGLFVQFFDREPTDLEIFTGEIKDV